MTSGEDDVTDMKRFETPPQKKHGSIVNVAVDVVDGTHVDACAGTWSADHGGDMQPKGSVKLEN